MIDSTLLLIYHGIISFASLIGVIIPHHHLPPLSPFTGTGSEGMAIFTWTHWGALVSVQSLLVVSVLEDDSLSYSNQHHTEDRSPVTTFFIAWQIPDPQTCEYATHREFCLPPIGIMALFSFGEVVYVAPGMSMSRLRCNWSSSSSRLYYFCTFMHDETLNLVSFVTWFIINQQFACGTYLKMIIHT